MNSTKRYVTAISEQCYKDNAAFLKELESEGGLHILHDEKVEVLFEDNTVILEMNYLPNETEAVLFQRFTKILDVLRGCITVETFRNASFDNEEMIGDLYEHINTLRDIRS